MIDKNNGIDYPAETLKKWKSEHESWIRENLNKKVYDDDSKIIEQLSEQTQLLRIIADSKDDKIIDKSSYPTINYDLIHEDTWDIIELENMHSNNLKIVEIIIYDAVNSELAKNILPKTIQFGEKLEIKISNNFLVDGIVKMNVIGK